MNPAEVQTVGAVILDGLKKLRARGEAYPGHGITAAELVARYNTRYGASVREKDFNEVVAYLRAERGEPVGSDVSGYYWCLTLAEWEPVRHRLLARINTQQRSADGPTLRFAREAQGALPMAPAERLIVDHFDAVKTS